MKADAGLSSRCMPFAQEHLSDVCPVCGKYTFEYAGDFDICPVCNWEDEPLQLENPDEEDCTNHMSLNQAREAWANGKRVDE